MRLAKLTASTAALLLSSSALLAQEAQSQTFQSVFIDVGGSAVLVPFDIAMEACGLDQSTLQTAFQGRLDDSGVDQTQFFAQMDSAAGVTGSGAMGDAAAQDAAAADTGTGDAMGTEGTASADAGAAAGAAGTAGDASGTATADAGTASGTGAAGAAGDTTQTAGANMTTDAGNATTDLGNSTDLGDATATADASGAAAGDASGAAAGTEMTDTATADASGAAGQDATAAGSGEVQNVETTAADTTGDAGAMGSANADPFLVFAACQIDQARATELQVDLTRTGSGLGFDAATLGIQSGTANQ